MKNVLLVLLFGVLGMSQSISQAVGIKGGLSIANLSTNDGEVEDKNAIAGFTAGVFMNAPIGEIFALQPELLYTQKGGKYEVLGIDVENRSAYLELPLLLQFTLLDPIYIYAGPQVSYLLSVKTTYNDGGQIEFEDEEDPDDYNRTDIGGAAGIGFNFDKVTLDARVVLGVIDYDKERSIQSVEVEARNLKNFNFQVTAGIKF